MTSGRANRAGCSRSNAQAVPCHPCSPASMRSRRRSSRCAVALSTASENSGSLRHSVIASWRIPARRPLPGLLTRWRWPPRFWQPFRRALSGPSFTETPTFALPAFHSHSPLSHKRKVIFQHASPIIRSPCVRKCPKIVAAPRDNHAGKRIFAPHDIGASGQVGENDWKAASHRFQWSHRKSLMP